MLYAGVLVCAAETAWPEARVEDGRTDSIMRILLDIVRQSLATLWAHKLRSFLTMFGIAWGVGSLLLLVGLGEGFRNGQGKQLATLGQNIMFMFPGRIPAVEGSTQSGQTYYF